MRPGVLWKVSPRCSASSPEVGFHSTFVDVTTTGVSSGRAPRLARSASASASSWSSRSIHSWGWVARTRNPRSASVLGENREPISWRLRCPSPSSRYCRRSTKARRITSAMSGSAANTSRSDARSIMIARPDSTTSRGQVGPLPAEHRQLAEEAARCRGSPRSPRRRARCGCRSHPRRSPRSRTCRRRPGRGTAPAVISLLGAVPSEPRDLVVVQIGESSRDRCRPRRRTIRPVGAGASAGEAELAQDGARVEVDPLAGDAVARELEHRDHPAAELAPGRARSR